MSGWRRERVYFDVEIATDHAPRSGDAQGGAVQVLVPPVNPQAGSFVCDAIDAHVDGDGGAVGGRYAGHQPAVGHLLQGVRCEGDVRVGLDVQEAR